MRVDHAIFAKIKRRTAELGVRYEPVQKPEHWRGYAYWKVYFPETPLRGYTYKGYLHEIALRLGWITRDDLRRARGTREIPLRCPKQPFWATTWAWGGGLYPPA